MRVVFAATPAALRAHALHEQAAGIEPHHVELREGEDPGPAVAAADPDAVVVIGPERVAPGALQALGVPVLGMDDDPREVRDPLGALAIADASQFSAIACTDPRAAEAAQAAGIEIWRTAALPVADGLFEQRERDPGHVVFHGASTEHRERWLTPAKHAHDVLHVAHGARAEELLQRAGTAIVLRSEEHGSPDGAILAHLAAGRLVLAEPLSAPHGLEPGIDYVEVQSPAALADAVGALRANPSLHAATRIRGNLKSQAFRASRVWPRLIGDLCRHAADGARAAALS